MAEGDWEKLVLISGIILFVVFLFKIIFWLSLGAIIVGVIWLIIMFCNQDGDFSWIPIILLIGGVVMAIISYQVGYGFEKSDIGKPIVDSAKTIVNTDNTLNELKQNVTMQLISTTLNLPTS